MIRPTIRSDNLRGASLMAAAMSGFAVSDACMKALGETLPLFQILLLRGLGTTTVLGLLCWRAMVRPRAVARRDWGRIALRACLEVGAAWFFVTALFLMPLADLSAILQALPLTVTLAAALLLGERVGWRRWTAIGVGFCGVMLIVRPGGEGFGWPAMYGLASVACVTLRDVVARRVDRRVPNLLIAGVTSGAVTAFGAVGSVFVEWGPVDARALALLGGAAAFVVMAYVASVGAMRTGDIGFVAPFRYVSLLVSIVLGLALFGTFPDRWTLIGAGIVVATGLFTLWREGRGARVDTGGPPPYSAPTRAGLGPVRAPE